MARNEKIIVVDDEPEMLKVIEEILQSLSVKIVSTENSEEAVKRIRREDFDLLITDIKMSGLDGIQLLKTARDNDQDLPVILITAYPEMETAVAALRQGAFDYLTKPFHPDELRLTAKRALEERRLKRENRLLTRHLQHQYQPKDFIGNSGPIKELIEQVRRIALVPANVLITGESGTGKELIARMVHEMSNCKGNFVPIDCAAISASLMESELFGYEKGAYTGALSTTPGLFEFAKEGTVFLDEICELPLELQTKLLRLIEDGRVRHVGGREFIPVNARIVAATNREVQQEVKERRFREDLYFRLNVIHLHIPPLRQRREDITLLINYFIQQFSRDCHRSITGITDEARDVMLGYRWPGNVRELQNTLKHAVVFATGELIQEKDLPESFLSIDTATVEEGEGFFSQRQEQMLKFEKEYFTGLLDKFKGDVSKVAAEANVPLGTAYRLLKKHNLDPAQFRT